MTAMFKKAQVNRREDLIAWWQNDLNNSPPQIQLGPNGKGVSDKKTEKEDDKIISLEAKPGIFLTVDEEDIMDLLERGMSTEEIASKTRSTKSKVTKQLKDLLKRAN